MRMGMKRYRHTFVKTKTIRDTGIESMENNGEHFYDSISHM